MTAWQDKFDLGMQRGSAGDLPGAQRAFREAIALAPDEPYPHYELGYTLALEGHYPQALVELRRTRELQRGFFLVDTEIYLCEQLAFGKITDEMLRALRRLIHLGDTGQATTLDAEQLSRKLIARAPECALAYFFLGKAILDRLPEQAAAALERCVALGPDDTTAINARFHLGVLRRQAGALDEARAIFAAIASDFAGHPYAELAAAESAGA